MAIIRMLPPLAACLLLAMPAAALTPAPAMHIPGEHFVSPPVMEGNAVVHDFVVENRGDGPLEITRVRTD